MLHAYTSLVLQSRSCMLEQVRKFMNETQTECKLA